MKRTVSGRSTLLRSVSGWTTLPEKATEKARADHFNGSRESKLFQASLRNGKFNPSGSILAKHASPKKLTVLRRTTLGHEVRSNAHFSMCSNADSASNVTHASTQEASDRSTRKHFVRFDSLHLSEVVE
jgi:hypothetical protein